MDRREKQDRSRHKYRRQDEKKKEKKMNPNSKKCRCGGEMRCRGASDAMGGISWKCKNKSCGRTVWERKLAAPPVPLAPQSYLR